MCSKWIVLFLACSLLECAVFEMYCFYKNLRHIVPSLTTASHQKSTAAKECDSPAANGVTEHEKLTSHVFNLHPKNSTRSLRLSSDLNGGASCTFIHKNSFILAENQIRVSGVLF